ncbi:MAG TPA: pitrilysin family protein, partial [Thermoanaerobaculia bacterium]|nr:pitrilysin family protein [Thermoanaerobaculia bacterium]
TLPNGLTVWIVKRLAFPKVSAALVVRGGGVADPADMEGVSQLLASTLKEGTSKKTSRQIAEELQAIGGDLSVSASYDAVYLRASALATGGDRLFALLGAVALTPAFPASEVELAKENAIQELEAAESTPDYLARKAFAEAVYGNHPYHVVWASRETIGKTTPELLRKEHARRFRPDQALLVVAGDLDEAATKAAVAKAFGAWKGAGDLVADAPASPGARSRAIQLVDRPGSVQSTIVSGRTGPRASDPDWYDVLVANTIYADAFGSRLVKNIREDKGYTYSPSGDFSTRRAGSLLQMQADVRNEVTAATLLEVFYELDRLAATKPTTDELAGAKRYQGGLYLLRNQIQGAVAGTLARNWVNGLPPEALGEFVTKVNAVSAEGVQAAGKKHFLSSSQTVVVVGDTKAVRPQLELYGAVKEIKP